jgi:hypothetical protein
MRATVSNLPKLRMGYFTEYLGMQLDFTGLQKEREKQLNRISELRGGRAVLGHGVGPHKREQHN